MSSSATMTNSRTRSISISHTSRSIPLSSFPSKPKRKSSRRNPKEIQRSEEYTQRLIAFEEDFSFWHDEYCLFVNLLATEKYQHIQVPDLSTLFVGQDCKLSCQKSEFQKRLNGIDLNFGILCVLLEPLSQVWLSFDSAAFESPLEHHDIVALSSMALILQSNFITLMSKYTKQYRTRDLRYKIDQKDEYGNTLLYYTSDYSKHCEDCAKAALELLIVGANPFHECKYYETPFSAAISQQDAHLVKEILSRELPKELYENAFSRIDKMEDEVTFWRALGSALASGYEECIEVGLPENLRRRSFSKVCQIYDLQEQDIDDFGKYKLPT